MVSLVDYQSYVAGCKCVVEKKDGVTSYSSENTQPKMKELCDCYCNKYAEFTSQLKNDEIKICDLCQSIKYKSLQADLFFKEPGEAVLTKEQESLLEKLQNKFQRYLDNSIGNNLVVSKLKYGMFHSKFLNYQLYDNYNDGMGGLFDPVAGR